MASEFQILEWDSDFFGYKVARLQLKTLSASSELDRLIKKLRDNQIKLTYLTVPDSDQQTLILLNDKFKPVTTNIVFSRTITKQDIGESSEVSEYNHDIPDNELYELALQAGHDSRYKLDTHFKNNEFERLYKLWIENSVNKSIADFTFVWRDNHVIKGFVTLKIKNDIGVIGLIAVDATMRGKGIGKKLLNAVFNCLAKKQVKYCEVATQKGNTGAVNFYKSAGFDVKSSDVYYHIWL
jgi:dTDP-4-amino-4,6-dideoxy-D-galactose acyltransferase